jgi:hypothetical protein
MTPNERNRFDKRDSLEIGNTAQGRFVEVAIERDWEVTPATKDQDIDEHWDYMIIRNETEEKFRVDIKGLKRAGRWDVDVQEEWVWVESHGVRKNDSGWLFGGRADLFAFERKDDFVIIKKGTLQYLVNLLVDGSKRVRKACEAKYKTYSRQGRSDLLLMIEMKHIAKDCWEIWPKVEQAVSTNSKLPATPRKMEEEI